MDLRGGLEKLRRLSDIDGKRKFLNQVDEHSHVNDDICHRSIAGLEDQCAVCLTGACETMLLPCMHKFHGDCIMQWVKCNFKCPLCRAEISQFIPLGDCKPETQKQFIQVWNNHYLQKTKTKEIKESKVSTKPRRKYAMSRTKSVLLDRFGCCRHCNDHIQSEFIYFAFDSQFCSPNCRLSFAKSENVQINHGSTSSNSSSLYVDFSQIKKYL